MNQPRIEITELGSWGAVELLAEYDGEDDVIRVNARVVERVQAAAGDLAAARFIACAIAHERHHRAHPYASEQEARSYAAAASGFDAAALAALLTTSRESGGADA
ncbi:MAG: hypothetical protein M3R44_04885 [Candidatus Eremiobacteraeota bacterium]|nr:hypothetical protein [Candidatus Eremiobacteraeota bacterium]